MPAQFSLRVDGARADLRFVPADRRGVLDADAMESLMTRSLEIPPSARLAVLEGARDDLFAAGADLETIAALEPEEAIGFAERGREAIAGWESLAALTVAVVRGACFGGALDVVLATDVVVAFPAARFAHPGARRGIVTGWGGTVRARRRLAPAALERLFVEAEPLDAERAHAEGLVDFLVRSDEEKDRLLDRLAGELGERFTQLKRVVRETEGLTLAQALVVEERQRELLARPPADPR